MFVDDVALQAVTLAVLDTTSSANIGSLTCKIYRVSYMSLNVLLNLLNELKKNDKMRGFTKHLSNF